MWRNYLATHHMVWDHRHALNFTFQTPAWRLNSTAMPPHGLPCKDVALFEAQLDEKEINLPRAFVLEAIDRAIALTVVDMYQRGGATCIVQCLVPADAIMLVSTSYETTRGSLTFACGTLSIGHLAAVLIKHFTGELQGDYRKSTIVTDLANIVRALRTVRRRVADTRAVSRLHMEQQLDQLLCSVLGKVGLEMARLGEQHRRVEAFVTLLTGLSAVDLVRARRLHAAQMLHERPDIVAMLRIIDELGGGTVADPTSPNLAGVVDHSAVSLVTCAEVRRRLADDGVIAEAVDGSMQAQPFADDPISKDGGSQMVTTVVRGENLSGCGGSSGGDGGIDIESGQHQVVRATLVRTSSAYDYTFVVPALPVWNGETSDGQLPSARVSRSSSSNLQPGSSRRGTPQPPGALPPRVVGSSRIDHVV